MPVRMNISGEWVEIDDAAVRNELERLTIQLRMQVLDANFALDAFDLAISKRASVWRDEIQSRAPFIYARTFMFALDNLQKACAKFVTAAKLAPADVKEADKAWDEALPGLRALRNSSHHGEDRIRGYRYREKINPAAFDGLGVQVPEGAAIFMENLSDRTFFSTGGDGRVASLEITTISLVKAAALAERALSSVPWTGEMQTVPAPTAHNLNRASATDDSDSHTDRRSL